MELQNLLKRLNKQLESQKATLNGFKAEGGSLVDQVKELEAEEREFIVSAEGGKDLKARNRVIEIRNKLPLLHVRQKEIDVLSANMQKEIEQTYKRIADAERDIDKANFVQHAARRVELIGIAKAKLDELLPVLQEYAQSNKEVQPLARRLDADFGKLYGRQYLPTHINNELAQIFRMEFSRLDSRMRGMSLEVELETIDKELARVGVKPITETTKDAARCKL